MLLAAGLQGQHVNQQTQPQQLKSMHANQRLILYNMLLCMRMLQLQAASRQSMLLHSHVCRAGMCANSVPCLYTCILGIRTIPVSQALCTLSFGYQLQESGQACRAAYFLQCERHAVKLVSAQWQTLPSYRHLHQASRHCLCHRCRFAQQIHLTLTAAEAAVSTCAH